MRKRIHKVANFLAFNLLFFALYLNFIYKDPSSIPSTEKSQQKPAAAFSGTLTDEKTAETKDTPVLTTKSVEKTAASKGTH